MWKVLYQIQQRPALSVTRRDWVLGSI